MMDGMTNKDGMHTGNRPCEYKFKRYIGQPVSVWNRMMDEHIHGTIVDIKPYYTEVCVGDGRTLMCTPHGDFRPLKPMPCCLNGHHLGQCLNATTAKAVTTIKAGGCAAAGKRLKHSPPNRSNGDFNG